MFRRLPRVASYGYTNIGEKMLIFGQRRVTPVRVSNGAKLVRIQHCPATVRNSHIGVLSQVASFGTEVSDLGGRLGLMIVTKWRFESPNNSSLDS